MASKVCKWGQHTKLNVVLFSWGSWCQEGPYVRKNLFLETRLTGSDFENIITKLKVALEPKYFKPDCDYPQNAHHPPRPNKRTGEWCFKGNSFQFWRSLLNPNLCHPQNMLTRDNFKYSTIYQMGNNGIELILSNDNRTSHAERLFEAIRLKNWPNKSA